jgi:hypothetical protein
MRKDRVKIQMSVVEAFDDLGVYHGIERREIHHHSRFRIHGSRNQHFYDVIMAMAVRMIALAIGGAILLGSQCVGMQTMAGAEQVTAAKVRVHASPRYSAKISGVS